MQNTVSNHDADKVLPIALGELPPLNPENPEAYGTREWVIAARITRRVAHQGLETGFYEPTSDVMEALEALEQVLEPYAHIR